MLARRPNSGMIGSPDSPTPEMAEAQRPGWHRTLYIVFFAQLMTAVGFSSIFPFLPLYVKSLGASTSLSLELLAGLVFSAQAFTMMLGLPDLGRLGRPLRPQGHARAGRIWGRRAAADDGLRAVGGAVGRRCGRFRAL